LIQSKDSLYCTPCNISYSTKEGYSGDRKDNQGSSEIKIAESEQKQQNALLTLKQQTLLNITLPVAVPLIPAKGSPFCPDKFGNLTKIVHFKIFQCF